MATRTGAGRVVGWIGVASVDAVGRILLLTGSTAILSRMLTPQDFGVTALALTVVAVMSIFVGAPFEEALTQRRSLRRAHVEAALSASWAIGLVLFALSIPGAMALAHAYDEPELASLLPVAALAMFFSGHADVATALARRRRRFNDVAIANLAGHAIGVSLALALAFAGGGVWALVALRLFVMIARAAILQWRLPLPLLPRWSTPHFKEIGRFAGFSFLDRLADNLTYLAFNNVVGALYGVATLGHVNMAMRLIEPIRGAVIATAHNLAFSFFAAAGHDQRAFRDAVATIAPRAALLVAPAFVGLAAVTPALLPVVAGPGWEPAIDVAVLLALGAAVALPARLVFTALSAKARPEYGLTASLAGFGVTLAALIAAIPLGPVAVGLARLLGDATLTGLAMTLASGLLGWRRRDRLAAFAPPLLLSGLMGFAAWSALRAMAPYGNVAALLVAIPVGVAVYGALALLFARGAIRGMKAALRPAAAE